MEDNRKISALRSKKLRFGKVKYGWDTMQLNNWPSGHNNMPKEKVPLGNQIVSSFPPLSTFSLMVYFNDLENIDFGWFWRFI